MQYLTIHLRRGTSLLCAVLTRIDSLYGPIPALFTAATSMEYVMIFINPVSVQFDAVTFFGTLTLCACSLPSTLYCTE